MEVQVGKISTWLTPAGEVRRVRIVEHETHIDGRKMFVGYLVDETDSVLKNSAGIPYPLINGFVESLGG